MVSCFFSSRRRHTRFDCDWSSDVCSSDLVPVRKSPTTTSGPSNGSRSISGFSASRDRKSTRLNSSHSQISYAVFCLKKKKKKILHLVALHNNADPTTCLTTLLGGTRAGQQ